MQIKLKNKKQIFTAILSVLISVFLVATATYAVTTIGSDVTVGGSLTVTGTSTLASTLYANQATSRIGIGTTGPNRKLDILDASNPQLRLTQTDGTKYIDIQASSTGDLIITSNLGQMLKTNSANGNILLGQQAGTGASYEGQYSTFLGYQAGYRNTHTTGDEGKYNTYVGYQSGYGTTTNKGYYNAAMGATALFSNTTGLANSAMGAEALYSNTTGIGNSAMGVDALYNNTEGPYNTAVGAWALNYNTTAWGNSAVGGEALYSNTTGQFNTAMGEYALYNKATGNYNTAVGVQAGLGATGYHLNVPGNDSFSNNSLFGYQAGYKLTIGGDNNILLGYKAGDNLTTGNSNIIIGYDIDAPAVTSSQTLNIGNLIFATGLNATGTTISTGKVGIATTTPESKLHVQGGAITVSGTSGTALEIKDGGDFVVKNVDNTHSFNLRNDGSHVLWAGDIPLDWEGFTGYNFTGGNVGIGTTTPAATLHLYQTASTTLMIGASNKTACIVMGDSDGAGVTYVTALDGILTATTTKPVICQ